MENDSKNRPAYEKRVGSIRLTIWMNRNSETGKPWFSASIVRRFRDKANDEFKDAHTFNGVADLLVVGELVEQGLAFLREQGETEVAAEAAN